ncbi:MAG: hypothetical protein ACKKL5_01775 [Candidatus Komeilibacteria bacterium]
MRGPKTKINFNFSYLRILLLLLVVGSLFGYLMAINNSATIGIEISGLQQNIYQLQEQNRELELQISHLRSISRIENLAGELNMVAVDNYAYVGGDTAVAVK